jgi:hypothetical protein
LRSLVALLLAAVSVSAAWAAGHALEARGPTPQEARVLEAVNARRRAAGARPLEWDAVSAAILRDVFRAEQKPSTAALDLLLQQQRGFDTGWNWSARVVQNPLDAAAQFDATILGREHTHGAVAIFEDGYPTADYVRVVMFASQVPAVVGRHNANGPPGSYRYRCPSCGHEVTYDVRDAPGKSFDCPNCKTLVSPYLEDTRNVVHWPTWYVQPFAPFASTNAFLIWQWVNQKVRYDHSKADHDQPGWQTPQETNDKGTGVCRDTAVMLAAWLQHAGKDARVVTGLDAHREHHAWVVLTDGDTRYLMESAFDGNMSRRYPPRLELATDYYPTKMEFDAQHVWLNKGQQQTRDYFSTAVWLPVEEAP